MELEERKKRVQRMELYYDSVSQAWKMNSILLQEDRILREMLQELIRYYESGEWMEDYQYDECVGFPSDLKRGILSQDGFYNLICEIGEEL